MYLLRINYKIQENHISLMLRYLSKAYLKMFFIAFLFSSVMAQNLTYNQTFSFSLGTTFWQTYSDQNVSHIGILGYNSISLTVYNFDQYDELQNQLSIPIQFGSSVIQFSADGKIIIIGNKNSINIFKIVDIINSYTIIQAISDTNYDQGIIAYSRSHSTLVYQGINQTINIYSLKNGLYNYNNSFNFDPKINLKNIFVSSYGSFVVLSGYYMTNGTFFVQIYYYYSNSHQNIQNIFLDLITSISISPNFNIISIGTFSNILIYAFNNLYGQFLLMQTIYTYYTQVNQIALNINGTTVVCVYNNSVQIYKYNQGYYLSQTISFDVLLQKSILFAADQSKLIINDKNLITFWQPSCYSTQYWDSKSKKCILNCSLDSKSNGSNSNNKSCNCRENYFWNTNLFKCSFNCVNVLNSFQQNFDYSTCRCKANSNFAPNNNSCILSCSQVANSYGTNLNQTQCNCLPNYFWNTSIYSCQINCSNILNSNGNIFNNSNCVCNIGYSWNSAVNLCNLIPISSTSNNNYILIIIMVFICLALILICVFCMYRRLKKNQEGKVFVENQPSSVIDLGDSKLQINSPTCSICLQPSIAVKTSCAHYFHFDCIMPWCQKQMRCPNCNNTEFAIYMMCRKCQKYNSLISVCGVDCRLKKHTQCHKRIRKQVEMCIFCRTEQQ